MCCFLPWPQMGVARTAVRPALQSGLLTSVPTETQSLSLMRNLIRATVSTITYLRQMFSEEHFCDHSMCGMRQRPCCELRSATDHIARYQYQVSQAP